LVEILDEVKVLEDTVKQIKHDTFKLMWFMRGSISANEAFALGYEEREIISKIIEQNLETTKESNLPFF